MFKLYMFEKCQAEVKPKPATGCSAEASGDRGASLSPRRPRGTSLSRPEASLTLAISPGGLAGPRANSAEASRALALSVEASRARGVRFTHLVF